MGFRHLFVFILFTTCFVSIAQAQVREFNLEINSEAGFDQLQEPFSNFLHSAGQIDISQGGSTSRVVFPEIQQAWKFWNQANQWVKDKTGLDIFGILKVVGNILLFVLDITVVVIQAMIRFIHWLLSLIPV